MKILVIIPIFNERRTIGQIVRDLRNQNIEVLVMDDGSDDSSGILAEQNGAVVIRNSSRQGKGYSLRVGFDYVIKNNYDGVITLDGDGQHDVEDIGKFIKMANDNYVDIIIGNRMDNSKGMPWVRFLTNKFMSFIISLACRQSIPDTQCGYRYLSKKILKQILLSSDDFEIETEILIEVSRKGFKVYAVPIKTIYSDEESKIKPFKDTIRFFRYFFRAISSKSK